MNKMTVWVVGNGVPTKKNPMLSQFSYMQAKEIARNNDIRLLYIAIDLRSIRRKRPFRAVLKKDNMEIVYWSFPLGAVPQKLSEFVGYISTKNALKYCKKKYGEPSIIHTHFCKVGYNVLRNKELFPNTKFVHTEHWSVLIRDDVSIENKRLAHYTCLNADKVIAVSEALKEKLNNEYDAKALYIPNMIDENIFHIDSTISKKGIKEFLFISVGRLTYQKNHESLVLAFSKAFEKKEKVKLIIVGDGENRHKLEKIIKKQGRENDIILLGQMNHEQIASLFNISDCFVLCSRFETFGVVYVEANMCGLPVIATKCGGPESIVNEKNGIIIEKNKEKELIKALKFMRENSAKYDREKISSAAKDLYSCKSVTERIINVYSKL